MFQPIPCDEDPSCYASTPVLPSHPTLGYWFWGILFLAVAVYELWAVITHHPTLSQTVQRGPRWFKWALGVGFIALLGHLFL